MQEKLELKKYNFQKFDYGTCELGAEQLEKEQRDVEQRYREQLEKEQLEKEQLEKEQLEKEQFEKEQFEKEQLEKEQLEKERLKREEHEAEQYLLDWYERRGPDKDRFMKKLFESGLTNRGSLECYLSTRQTMNKKIIKRRILKQKLVVQNLFKSKSLEQKSLEQKSLEREVLNLEVLEKRLLAQEALVQSALEFELLGVGVQEQRVPEHEMLGGTAFECEPHKGGGDCKKRSRGGVLVVKSAEEKPVRKSFEQVQLEKRSFEQIQLEEEQRDEECLNEVIRELDQLDRLLFKGGYRRRQLVKDQTVKDQTVKDLRNAMRVGGVLTSNFKCELSSLNKTPLLKITSMSARENNSNSKRYYINFICQYYIMHMLGVRKQLAQFLHKKTKFFIYYKSFFYKYTLDGAKHSEVFNEQYQYTHYLLYIVNSGALLKEIALCDGFVSVGLGQFTSLLSQQLLIREKSEYKHYSKINYINK
jgi:hypothetical protein